MASGNFFHYIYPTSDMLNTITSPDNLFEFEESDVWNHAGPTESKKAIPNFRPSSKKSAAGRPVDRSAAASLPVGVPDWSKILKDEYRDNRRIRDSDNRRIRDSDEDSDEDADVDDRVPPHVYLARTRGASFSVHEGIGRTLKGRDLRRVRNAIWKKVGFED